MTTYTMQGFQVDWRDTADHEDTEYTGFSASATFTVVAAAGGGFTYVNDAAEDDGDVWAEVDLTGTYNVGLDDFSVWPTETGGVQDSNVSFLELTWKSGGKTYTTTLVEFSIEWGDDSDGRMTGSDYYFVLDGASLPGFSSLSEFETFTENNLTGVSEASGDLAEGEYIEWADLAEFEIATEDDEIYGTNRRDTLNGGIGDDYFVSSKGNDTYNGGQGYDQVTFQNDPSGVIANLLKGTATDGWGNTDTLRSIEMLRGSAHDDTFIGNNGSNILRGLAGDDILNGGKGRDEVRYDRDDRHGGDSGVTVNLQQGTATDGFGDTDTLRNIENVRGSEYNDRITGDGKANQLEGEGGNDKLYGMNGKDTLSGGAGRDLLDGGNGNDDLYGNGGADKFVFKGNFGHDTIHDFQTAGTKERIDLSAIEEIKSFRDLKNNHLTKVDGNAVITDDDGNTITLDGVVKADLSANDFIF